MKVKENITALYSTRAAVVHAFNARLSTETEKYGLVIKKCFFGVEVRGIPISSTYDGSPSLYKRAVLSD